MKFISTSMSLLTLFSLASCNDSSSVNDQSQSRGMPIEMVRPDGSNVDGFYVGEIFPLNHNLHFKKLGVVGVERSGDEFSVKIKMDNAPRNAHLRHALYTGNRCPTMNDDLNKDAFIDTREMRIALGEVVVPFDGDLSSQRSGLETSQVSDLNGNYSYSQRTSFELMFSDLKSPDLNLPSYMRKLTENEGLALAGKVVLFQGVNPEVTLPKTLHESADGLSLHDSLPTGCAVLWKASNAPEELSSL